MLEHKIYQLFADCSQITELKRLTKMGIISGITTNPLIVAKEAGKTDLNQYYRQILTTFPHLPVSMQLLDEDLPDLLQRAREYACLGPNVVVKVPMLGDGRGLTVLSQLTKEGIKTNMTALMSAEQTTLALMVDPPPNYVSLFFNRIRDGGGNPEKEIENTRQLLEKIQSTTRIIVGSIRQNEDVRLALSAGAHIVTVPPPIFDQMIFHPQSIKFIQQCQEEWSKLLLPAISSSDT